MVKRDWSKDWEMCQRATFGVWRQEELGGEKIAIRTDFSTVAVLDGASRYGTHYLREDARFIVESREALPYWLQRVKDLEERLKAVERRRCETCKWWARFDTSLERLYGSWGECLAAGNMHEQLSNADCKFHCGEEADFLTRPDFGCVCWEAKEAGP